VDFEWDDDKAKANRSKHGVGFETAIAVFDDPFELTELDQFVDGEYRWKTLGRAGPWSVLVVVHVMRDRDEEVIRIISARAANRSERNRYERRGGKDRPI